MLSFVFNPALYFVEISLEEMPGGFPCSPIGVVFFPCIITPKAARNKRMFNDLLPFIKATHNISRYNQESPQRFFSPDQSRSPRMAVSLVDHYESILNCFII